MARKATISNLQPFKKGQSGQLSTDSTPTMAFADPEE